MTAGQWWHHLTAWAARQGQPPSHVLVLGTGLLAAAAVASHRVWPVARTVVTIAHEGGHALAAVATGRRLHSVRVLHSTAGVTVSEGSPAGPGVVLTALAGYLAAPLLGLGAAALLAAGHLLSVLLLALAGLAGLATSGRWARATAARTADLLMSDEAKVPVAAGSGVVLGGHDH